MNKLVMLKVGPQWKVVMVVDGRLHEYLCESHHQAQRWMALLSRPVRAKKGAAHGPMSR